MAGMPVVDFHSHILPDMDDGSDSLETSLAMLRASRAAGVDLMVATSHYYRRKESIGEFLERREDRLSGLLPHLDRTCCGVIPGAEVALYFGMDEDVTFDIIRRREQYKGVKIVGLHYFTGTAKRKAKPIERECDYLMDLTARIKNDLGFTVERIEYGTGLAVDYFSDNADAEEEERLASISPKLQELASVAELTVEMGRFFAAPCGYYLTKVVDTKTNFDINYAIVDGGMNQVKYNGQLQGMQIPEILHLTDRDKAEDKKPWTLCGSICTTADILARNAEFDDLQIGDILVFCRTGAYSCMEGISTFLSREMPVIAEYSEKEGLRILREMLYSDEFNTPKR